MMMSLWIGYLKFNRDGWEKCIDLLDGEPFAAGEDQSICSRRERVPMQHRLDATVRIGRCDDEIDPSIATQDLSAHLHRRRRKSTRSAQHMGGNSVVMR